MDQDSLTNSFYYFLNRITYDNTDSSIESNINYESDLDFQLNQNIIDNAHLLRQTFELFSNNNNNNLNTNNINTNNLNTNNLNTNNINTNNINTNNLNTNNINVSTNTFSVNNLSNLLNNNLNERLNLSFERMINIFGIFLDDQFEDFDNLEDVKVTLSEEEFNNLDSCILNESILLNKQCNICLELVKISEKLKILKCEHIYHENCLKPWLTIQSTKCPVCRLNLREI